MKLQDDFDEHNKMSPMMVTALVAVTMFVAAVLIIVLMINSGNSKTDGQKSKEENYNTESALTDSAKYPDTQDLISDSGLSPEDLDFWDKYPEKTEGTEENEEKHEDSNEEEDEETDPSKDGKHTLVKSSDGEEEWVLISPYLPKNDYDYTKLVLQSDLMKYYEDGKLVSYVGTDISKYQDFIDFNKIKKAGIQFVMIRVGARGYGTGQLVMDEYFSDNIKRATDAGLEIGLYFSSQAISEEEALEEAQMVLDSIGEYKITYPIAFDMEYVVNDVARIEVLSKTEKTNIAKAFLNKIEESGYKAMLYGSKEWLIKEIDMSKLTAYDVWLSQIEDVPDYPYKFTMWQYSTTALIDGISGYSNLNISFIDYSEK